MPNQPKTSKKTIIIGDVTFLNYCFKNIFFQWNHENKIINPTAKVDPGEKLLDCPHFDWKSITNCQI